VIGDILQPTHLLFVLVIALLVLGPKRLPEVGRALGRGLRDFRNALNTDELRDQMLSTSSVPAEPASAEPFTPAPSATADPLQTHTTDPLQTHTADPLQTHTTSPESTAASPSSAEPGSISRQPPQEQVAVTGEQVAGEPTEAGSVAGHP